MKRDALLFAYSIGCTVDELHFLYVSFTITIRINHSLTELCLSQELHPNFQVFPTYSIILPFKRTDQDVIDFYARSDSIPIPGVPKFDSTRVVDGQRSVQFFKALPTSSEGRKFELRSKVLGVYDKGKPGTVVETEQTIVDAQNGEVYTKMVGSAFFTGQGGWGGPKGDKAVNYDPPKGKKPDATFELPTTKETAHLYRLNGDYNPLHATPEPGAKMGFGGAIMHGLFSWNAAAHAVLKELGGSDPANLKEFQARFAAPVKPGDKLIFEMWRTGEKQGDGFEEIRFIVRVEGGKVVLSNGKAFVKVQQKVQSKL